MQASRFGAAGKTDAGARLELVERKSYLAYMPISSELVGELAEVAHHIPHAAVWSGLRP